MLKLENTDLPAALNLLPASAAVSLASSTDLLVLATAPLNTPNPLAALLAFWLAASNPPPFAEPPPPPFD